MKKLFATILLIAAVLVANVAFAGYCSEYKAKYPKNVKTKTVQLKSGKISTTTDYDVFKSKGGGLSLKVSDINGIKVAFLSFGYTGDHWRFYDGMSWGDGKEAHDIHLGMKPARQAFRGGVSEVIIAGISPLDLQKAVVIHVHSERNGNEVAMNAQHKRWAEWKAAVESAVKIAQDRS